MVNVTGDGEMMNVKMLSVYDDGVDRRDKRSGGGTEGGGVDEVRCMRVQVYVCTQVGI